MSRKQKREEDNVERLEKENRELKQTIRALTKRLKKIDRDFRAELETAQKEKHYEEEAVINRPKPKKCTVCERGEIIETTIGKSRFFRCSAGCENKGRLK